MDAEAVIEQIENLPPEERKKIQDYLNTDTGTNGEDIPASERVRRFREMMAKMPDIKPGPPVDVSKESIYQ